MQLSLVFIKGNPTWLDLVQVALVSVVSGKDCDVDNEERLSSVERDYFEWCWDCRGSGVSACCTVGPSVAVAGTGAGGSSVRGGW